MNAYVFILDENGNRITSLVDNEVSEKELLAKAKKEYPNADQYLYVEDGDSMLDEFMTGKLYVNGEFVEPPVVEPTKQEKIDVIKAEYEERFQTLEVAQRRKLLLGQDTSSLIAQYKKLNSEMIKRIAEVK